MKHNYISQGNNYISSKRASKISDYSSDYVGQLCREGKLDCKRVGHVWFVTEESLRAHMTRVWSDDALRTRASNLKRRFIKDQAAPSSRDTLDDSLQKISSKQAALLSGYAPDYIGQLCREKKLDAVMIGKTWFVGEESLKSHMEKIRAEEVARKQEKEVEERNSAMEMRDRSVQRTREAQVVSSRKSFPHATQPRKSGIFSAKSIVTFFVVLGLIATASLSVVRLIDVPNIAVKQPMVAGVYEAAQYVSELFASSFGVIAQIFRGQQDLAVNSGGSSSVDSAGSSSLISDSTGVANRGIAVAPMSDVKKQDEDMKAAIQQSFSDQVKVVPDKTGAAGVITPVFRKANSKDFMYVMVPVDSQQNSNQHPP